MSFWVQQEHSPSQVPVVLYDNTATWQEEFVANSDQDISSLYPRVAMSEAGNFIVMWLDFNLGLVARRGIVAPLTLTVTKTGTGAAPGR